MSRVLSLSLTDKLHAKVSEHAKGQGLTVYQYVRESVERSVFEDDHIMDFLNQFDELGE